MVASFTKELYNILGVQLTIVRLWLWLWVKRLKLELTEVNDVVVCKYLHSLVCTVAVFAQILLALFTK